MRDEFLATTIRILADRVNSVCSNPSCRAQTRGPRTEDQKAINIGKAAHITAASADGPRYDASLTTDERRHFSNGLWLCSSCADLIDSDPIRFPVELLNSWKQDAESTAFREIGQPRGISKGKYALISNAKRFGAETSVMIGDRVVPLAYLPDSIYPDSIPTWFVGNAYVVQFKVKKRYKYKYVVLDELRVTVHRCQEIPEYRPLYAVYPAETSLYTVVIDAPAEGHVRVFSAERYFEVNGPRECEEHRFIPLVLDNEIPHPVSLRIDASKQGLYYVSIEALISRGMNQECHTVMAPTPIIFERQDDPEDE